MEQSRTFFAKRNVIFGFLGKLLVIVLEFFSRAVFIKFLGEELLGISGVFTNVIQILSLAELGMANVVNFSFYKPLAENDHDRIAALVSFYRSVYNVIACVVGVIGVCLIPALKYLINTDIDVPNLPVIYLIFLAETVFSYLFVYKASLMNAAQRGYVVAKYDMVINVVRTGLQIAAIALFQSIELYLIVKVFFSIGINWIIAKRVEKDYPFVNKKGVSLSKTEKRGIANVIRSGFVYKISGLLLNSTDNILISMMVGTVMVGRLSNYGTIIMGIGSIYTIVFSNLTAGIGNLVSTETKERRLEVFNILLCVSAWMAIVFSLCFLLLSGEFITLWLGPNFVIDKGSVFAKVLMLYCSCALQPVYSFREALGLYQKTKYVMLTAALLNIALSIVMGFFWGMAGILIASLLSMLATYLWYEPIVLYRDCFGTSAKSYFVGRLKELAALALGIVVLGYFSNMWAANSWLSWLLKGCVLFVVTNAYCLLLFHRTTGFKGLVSRLKERLNK